MTSRRRTAGVDRNRFVHQRLGRLDYKGRGETRRHIPDEDRNGGPDRDASAPVAKGHYRPVGPALLVDVLHLTIGLARGAGQGQSEIAAAVTPLPVNGKVVAVRVGRVDGVENDGTGPAPATPNT